METFSRYLVSQSTSGGKFWEVLVEGSTLNIRYGKLGQDKAWSTQELDSHAAAVKEAEKKANGKLRKGYTEAPRPVRIREAGDLDLAALPFAGVFYFRAHDRYPGGNRDMFTVKVTLLHVPGGVPTFTIHSHRDWDGEHWVYPETAYEPADEAAMTTFIDAARALLAAGHSDIESSVFDGRSDSEEYDTEWTSLEFVLTELPAGSTDLSALEQGTPVLRARQKAVYARSVAEPPDALGQAFLDATFALTGMGRVLTYADNECAAATVEVDGESLGYRSAPVPVYL